MQTSSPQAGAKPGGAPIRFHMIRDTETGEAASLMVEHREAFDEHVRFGPAYEDRAQGENPALWLADRIERAACAEALAPALARPIFVPAPDSALEHADTPLACLGAVSRTKLLPQEFCIEFTDAAFAMAREHVEQHVRALRKRGFRVSLDLRRTHHCALSHNLRLMLDTVRVNACDLDEDGVAQTVDAAIASGMCVIAEKPMWRDTARLYQQGIGYALAPMADA